MVEYSFHINQPHMKGLPMRRISLPCKITQTITSQNGEEENKKYIRGNNKYKFQVYLSERQVKYLAYELTRTGESISTQLRHILDAHIDEHCWSNPKLSAVMDVLVDGCDYASISAYINHIKQINSTSTHVSVDTVKSERATQ